jgi:hypothetical protein
MPMEPLKPIQYMPNTGQHRYLITDATLEQVKNYQQALINGSNPGTYLQGSINYFLADLRNQKEFDPEKELTAEDREILKKVPEAAFLQVLMNTRHPTIYAERYPPGSGRFWNEEEYHILGKICSSTDDVEVYDNGCWGDNPNVGDGRYKDNPHQISLFCIPGAILKNNFPDHAVVVEGDQIVEQQYKTLYKEKLLVVFQQANDYAKKEGKKVFITTPTIGDGYFAGIFRGKTAEYFHNTIQELLSEHPEWNNIGCVWIDAFDSKLSSDTPIGSTKLRIRNTGPHASNGSHTLLSGLYQDLGQLSQAEEYAESVEEAEEFKQYTRAKIFAWDHFSFEGNDWLSNSRVSDEANMASCNALSILFGKEGEYRKYQKDPTVKYGYFPTGYKSWSEYAFDNDLKQSISDRLYVLKNGVFTQLPDPAKALEELKNAINSPSLPKDVPAPANDVPPPIISPPPDYPPPPRPEILLKIVNQLIENIKTKAGTRWTSGIGSDKIKDLEAIRDSLAEKRLLITDAETMNNYTQQIMNVCETKRNPLHFWKTPDSVTEYLELLKTNNIKFTPEKTKSAKPE